jgi:hypothetical protein
MIRRSGSGTTVQAADTAVRSGMAEVLVALDNVIDDDAALRRVLSQGAAGSARAFDTGTAAGRRLAPRPLTRRRLAPRPLTRRRLALPAGAAALAAAGVALAAIVVPGASHGRTRPPDVLAAYVVSRVNRALSAADPGMIAQMTVTTRGGSARSGGKTAAPAAEEWSYGDQWRSVTYSSAGHPAYDAGYAHGVYTIVSDANRTWARPHEPGGSPKLAPGPGSGCEPVIAAFPMLFVPGLPAGGLAGSWLPSTVARDLRGAVSCGTLTVAGRQHVDGIDAIELTSRAASPISETIWVSPDTYLPVRVVARPLAGQVGPAQTADITWLRPTAQNLALLAVPIPAGFRRVALITQTLLPFMQRVPAGPGPTG